MQLDKLCKKIMLTKGSEDYKKAQKIANDFTDWSKTQRWNDSSYFPIAFENLGWALTVIEKTETFAAKIAETVDKTMESHGYQVAYLSSKQAWILACCVVENGLDIERKSIYGI